MGSLRDQLFLQFVNKSITSLRKEFREKYTPKKQQRFLIKGITYEISPCKIDSDRFTFEISSKIPQDILPKQVRIETYFNAVIKLMDKAGKKPDESKMENIIRSAADEEYKERDYVKLTYKYDANELYTYEDVEKRFEYHKTNNIPIPNIPGVATPSGKLVLVLLEESMKNQARQNVLDLVEANAEMKKIYLAKAKVKSAEKATRKPAAKSKKPAKAKTAQKK